MQRCRPHQRGVFSDADRCLGFNTEGAAITDKHAGKIRATHVAVEKERLVDIVPGPPPVCTMVHRQAPP